MIKVGVVVVIPIEVVVKTLLVVVAGVERVDELGDRTQSAQFHPEPTLTKRTCKNLYGANGECLFNARYHWCLEIVIRQTRHEFIYSLTCTIPFVCTS